MEEVNCNANFAPFRPFRLDGRGNIVPMRQARGEDLYEESKGGWAGKGGRPGVEAKEEPTRVEIVASHVEHDDRQDPL